jgi:hypothetical protein
MEIDKILLPPRPAERIGLANVWREELRGEEL